MANQQQVDLLKQGVATAWNTWREEHPDTPISLNGVDLSEANPGELNLAGADLSHADLNGADLTGANLLGADMRGALLEEASLEGALITPEQLSQAKVGTDSL